MTRVAGLAALILAASAPSPRAAPPLPPPAPDRAAPAAEPALPDYEEPVERLAEIMGTLAFMQGLCGQPGPDWRAKMADLLEAEGTTPERRARLAGSFNRGFEGYRLTYRTCTAAARTVVARTLDAGVAVSAALQRQFPLE